MLNRSKPLVLVVDDDDMVRLLFTETLATVGFQAIEASNGKIGIEKFKQHRPDAIILDIDMPIMDGLKCCSEIRALAYGQRVPILMVTGQGDDESVEAAYHAGAFDFVTKPVNWPSMPHRLRFLLKVSTAFSELEAIRIRLEHAQRIALLGSWEWFPKIDKVHCSQFCGELLGQKVENMTDINAILAYIHADDRQTILQWILAVSQGEERNNIDIRLSHQSTIVNMNAERQYDPISEEYFVRGTMQNITRLRQAEAQVIYLTNFDPNTGLINRSTFTDKLTNIIKEIDDAAGTKQAGRLAVLVIDFNRFHRINEIFGTNIGDQVIKQFAEKLNTTTSALRNSRQLEDIQIGRLEGDDFVMAIHHLGRTTDLFLLAENLHEELITTVTENSQVITLTSCVGIAVYPADGDNSHALITNATTALTQAKQEGMNKQTAFFNAELSKIAAKRLKIETKLNKALQEKQFLLHYQPQIDATQRKVVGVECLIRWRDPESGMVPPFEFIPIAEENGLIIEIGDWVIAEACAQGKRWLDMGLPPFKIAINISAMQFAQMDQFYDRVTTIVKQANFNPHFLELELTESLLMNDTIEAIALLKRLKEFGFRLSIDDFGTGYSSLAYLSSFNLDTLKIDRSFVDHVHENKNNSAIVRAIVSIAKGLDLHIVVEGSELQEEVDWMQKLGCDVFQGYFFSRPLAANDVTAYLQNNQI